VATINSLICWGGSAGRSVTVSNTTDLVTLTNHGLRNATGVAFTSGTLPTVTGTALALNTIYYAKWIAASTYELYREAALTNKIDFTSTGSSLIMKSAYYLGLSDKSRWTTGGVERIYEGLAAWNTGRAGAANTDEEVCEIGMAWDDIITSLSINVPSGASTITSSISGVRTGAFHFGVQLAGYVLRSASSSASILALAAPNCVADGITIYTPTNSGYYLVNLNGLGATLKNSIVRGAATGTGPGVSLTTVTSKLINSVITGCSSGVMLPAYIDGILVANCTITKNVNGFNYAAGYGANIQAYLYNNISIGNTTANYVSGLTNLRYATCNAGGAGEAWTFGTGATRVEITEASPFSATFASWGTSTPAVTDDFKPASATSLLTENGVQYYGAAPVDVAGSVRPSYPGAAYNTAVTAGSFVAGLSYTIAAVGTTDFTLIGASANTAGVTFKATGVGSGTGTATLNAQHDVGAYEYDLGYGGWPATTTVTFSGVAANSEIRVYDSASNEVAGIEDCAANQVLTWAVPSPAAVRIVIVNMAYRIMDFIYTSQPGNQTVPVQPEPDKWYNNPV
jgi:hypothetical protein